MISAGKAFLLSRIDPNGRCVDEYPEGNPRFGSRTGICVYALLSAGTNRHETPVEAAMNWLAQARFTGTVAVAMRAEAFASVRDGSRLSELTTDVKWLADAASPGGCYTIVADRVKPADAYDNVSAQAAVLAVADGAAKGVGVAQEYWQRQLRQWRSQQQPDGGWGFRALPNIAQARTYGSITAAALAAVYACKDNLTPSISAPAISPPEDRTVDAATDWLDRNYDIDANPGRGEHYYYQWLYALSRVGGGCGFREIAGRPWYAEGAAELLSRQNSDGSWGHGDRVSDTSCALLFLSIGRRPLLAGKLKYDGRWNTRPRDLANLARYLGIAFERTLGWQVVDINGSVEELCDVPLLYVSGAGPCDWSEDQIAALREYVWRGGTILSESAGNSADFTMDIKKLVARLFPQYPLIPLPEDHPIYRLHFSTHGIGGLLAASNGIRPLLIHSPREMSLELQAGPGAADESWFDLLANAYLYFTDNSHYPRAGRMSWPVQSTAASAPARTIRVARIRHNGNCDPEPLAWSRLGARIRARHGIALKVSEPIPFSALHAGEWPVAALTGTAAFNMDPASTEAVKRYIAEGGTIIIDAAGGSKVFASSVDENLLPLLGPLRPLAEETVLDGPEKFKVAYRRELAASLGRRKGQLRLQAIDLDGRPAVIYSQEDITAGLVGYPLYQLHGYTPQAAQGIMTNLLYHLAKTNH
jgi:hypothetical protein